MPGGLDFLGDDDVRRVPLLFLGDNLKESPENKPGRYLGSLRADRQVEDIARAIGAQGGQAVVAVDQGLSPTSNYGVIAAGHVPEEFGVKVSGMSGMGTTPIGYRPTHLG